MDPLSEIGPRVVVVLATRLVSLAVLHDAAKHWRHTVFHSTPAALIVALVVLMRLPGMVAPRILPAESCGAGNLGLAGAELGGAASAAGGIFTLVSIAFAVTVGLRLAQRHPYPLLHGQRNGWRRVGLAALSGAVLGVISLWAFATLGVEASGTFET